MRKYYSVVILDIKFRGIPSKAGQHYVFGGRADVKFHAYSMNEDELILLKDKLSDSDLEDSLKLIKGMTDDSLLQIKADIDEFLNDKEEKKETSDTNPFSALFSFLIPKEKKSKNPEKEKLEKLKKKGPKKDNFAEAYIRNVAEAGAMNSAFGVYDIYKKAHGMASIPYSDEAVGSAPHSSVERFFGFK
jgi:hypothetical protein